VRWLNTRFTMPLALLLPLAATALAAPPTGTAPTCEAVGQAIAAAYGPIGSIKDDTAAVHQLGGQAPYSVLRACHVYMPGKKIPLSITFDAPLNRQFLEGMAQFAGQHGSPAQKLDGSGYGDLAFLTPQMGGGNAVSALVGQVVVTITAWTSAKDTENIAEHIIKLM
jgi:hypothetical protein